MPALFTKLYCQHDRDQNLMIFDDVTGFARSHDFLYLEAYRDDFTVSEQQYAFNQTGSGGPTTFSDGFAFGLDGATPTTTSNLANVRFREPDAVSHTPWRFKKELRSGYYVAFNDADILSRVARSLVFSFTAVGASDIITLTPTTVGAFFLGETSATVALNYFSYGGGRELHPGQQMTLVSGTGLTGAYSAGTTYYAIPLGSGKFQVAATLAGAFAGTAIAIPATITANFLVYPKVPVASATLGIIQQGGTIPPGLVNGNDYWFKPLGMNTGQLYSTSTGSLIDITGAGTTPNYIAFHSDDNDVIDAVHNVLFIPDAWNPRFSTSNPLA